MAEFAGDLARDLVESIDLVMRDILRSPATIEPNEIMVVGATARDLHHHALGHRFATAATHDLDLALALSTWQSFSALRAAFEPVGSSGVRVEIAGVAVDLLPFGEIENPEGTSYPPHRGEPMGVWAISEVFARSLDLLLPSGVVVQLPTAVGYTAMKLGAWLDRSQWLETRDARDIALALYWYAESPEVESRIFETEDGQRAYTEGSGDLGLAAACLLGRDVALLIGGQRQAELLQRWPGDAELLAPGSQLPGRALGQRSGSASTIAVGALPGAFGSSVIRSGASGVSA